MEHRLSAKLRWMDASGHHGNIARLCVLTVAASYSIVASRTTPFTTWANVLTALPLVVVLLLAAAFRPSSKGLWRTAKLPPSPPRMLWPWGTLIGAIVAWELFCYAESPRVEHPTLSSLYDSIATISILKAALFFGWLALGWAVIGGDTESVR
jgi:hypothetical protein